MKKTAIAIALALSAVALSGMTRRTEAFACPACASSFEASMMSSFSVFMYRTDFSPMGALDVVGNLVQCPQCGFTFEKERLFTAAEVERLRPLLTTADWTKGRSYKSKAYCLYLEGSALGRAPSELAMTLLTASWELEARNPYRALAFRPEVIRLLEGALAGEASLPAEDRVRFLLIAADLYRKAERFAEAGRMVEEAGRAPGLTPAYAPFIEAERALIAEGSTAEGYVEPRAK